LKQEYYPFLFVILQRYSTHRNRAGVPQVILPQWFDLYNYAQLAEDINVGVWACPETSPDWTGECLRDALLKVVRVNEPAGRDMKAKAKYLEQKARDSPGQQLAAREIASLAAAGKA
jgi:UDP:flavonoid glycosyltransferase YjiC (YdhE family)